VAKMNNIFHLLDLKITLLGLFVTIITATETDVTIKIIGGIIFVGYTARRWWLMEKEHKSKKQ
jgi:hypothetical protein